MLHVVVTLLRKKVERKREKKRALRYRIFKFKHFWKREELMFCTLCTKMVTNDFSADSTSLFFPQRIKISPFHLTDSTVFKHI